LDFGLWQGLTMDEIKHRQPKLHKQWLESPSGVRPPGGETLEETQQRICRTVREILKKSKAPSPVIVLRPVALGVLQCHLESIPLDAIWQREAKDLAWKRYEVPEKGIG
jgi:broad specificity phosphatase PhoE